MVNDNLIQKIEKKNCSKEPQIPNFVEFQQISRTVLHEFITETLGHLKFSCTGGVLN